MKPKLIKTKQGFYQYRPLPSEKALEEYYSNKYYQKPETSGYTTTYTKAEIKYFRLKASLIFHKLMELRKRSQIKSLLDVGCGEGWLLDRFRHEKVKVSGVDYSSFALKKFHPHLMKYLEQGNIYAILDKYANFKKKFDVIVIANVIEHVPDPGALLDKIQELLSLNGMLIVVAPNDFSPLHEHLLKSGIIGSPFWTVYPDHLSYFNKKNFEYFSVSHGWQVQSVVADNPVDLNLLNENSNYVQDPKKGKNIHKFRVQTDNFLAGLSEVKLLELYTTLGSIGVGRNLSYFLSRRK